MGGGSGTAAGAPDVGPGVPGAGSGTAAGAPSAARRTGKVLWHLGHFTLIPLGGIRPSSMLYAALQLGQATLMSVTPVDRSGA